MAEYACGATGENPHWGEPVNPIDRDAAVGGSSSGSAVAVAAGLVYGSLGTDTAGSVRIPAATCGVVGLKPTHGAVDTTGTCALAPSLDTIGIVARSAGDAAELWAAVAPSAGANPPLSEGGDESRRWHLRTAWDSSNLSPQVGDEVEAFTASLARAHRVDAGDIFDRDALDRLAQTVLHVEAAATHAAALGAEASTLSAAARAVLLPGVSLPAMMYRVALVQRAARRQRFIDEHLNDAELLLTPALPRAVPNWSRVLTQSPDFDVRELLALHRHFAFVNYLGLPAIVFPIGSDRAGRPVSVQAIGRPGAEATLLAFARQMAAPPAP